ncbi:MULTISPECIES: class I SAM-dependent methyltransferase [unclassified Streptomyces]|uniref:class I SAM-dependent methyltransferase n=1 Tax=unclassified Streptomyces TaxID=2593676 RepID=UPI00325346F0
MAEQDFDVWTAGNAYERYMGRWSRLVADEFLTWLACGPGARWLDIGCGSGALTASVAARCRPRTLLGVERSTGFMAVAQAGASAPARFARADAQALPVRDDMVDAAVSALVLNFLPEPGAAVAEAARVVPPGGLVAAYVWDYAEGMGFLRHFWGAVATVDPTSAAALDEGRRFLLCRPPSLRRLWGEAGLTEVEVAPIEVPTLFADFADLWDPFLAGQGPAPGYVASLTPAARERLREALRERVPARPDGSIALRARAWAVRGRKAGVVGH